MTVLDERITDARMVKAERLAHLCRLAGHTAQSVYAFAREDRAQIERMAGVKRPTCTDETWTHVIGLLAGSSADRCPWCILGDPNGEPGDPKDYGHQGRCVR